MGSRALHINHRCLNTTSRVDFTDSLSTPLRILAMKSEGLTRVREAAATSPSSSSLVSRGVEANDPNACPLSTGYRLSSLGKDKKPTCSRPFYSPDPTRRSFSRSSNVSPIIFSNPPPGNRSGVHPADHRSVFQMMWGGNPAYKMGNCPP